MADDVTLSPTQSSDGGIGRPVERVDGRAKVTGAAQYAAEHPRDGLLYGFPVQSRIARGTIARIDASLAERAPGVVRVFTYENAPRMTGTTPDASGNRFERPVPVLQDTAVPFNGAYIALVVAHTYEEAEHAADLVRVTYDAEPPALDFHSLLHTAVKPEKITGNSPEPDTKKGNFERAFAEAAVQVDATYETAYVHNNAMEPHATTAEWDGEQLTLHDSTQAPSYTRTVVAKTLKLKQEQVRVVAKFIGGGFGSKYPTWGHAVLAAMAAHELARPVKVVVSRRQMFMTTGHRTGTLQRLRLGADRDGRLTAIAHDSWLQTSTIDHFCENTGAMTRMMYSGENRRTTHRMVPLNLPTPNIMRAPGECPGSFALESAMDELAVALDLDPIELRVRNEPEKDPEHGRTFSSRSLLPCLREGAARFGWSARNPAARSMREGSTLIGYGVAASCYPSAIEASEASVTVTADGRAHVKIGASDLGTGTWTVLSQIAADTLGFAPNRIVMEIGDTRLPPGAGSGGSRAAASCGSAVLEACEAAREKLVALARGDERSAAHGAKAASVVFREGRLINGDEPARSEPIDVLLARNAAALPLEVQGKIKPSATTSDRYSMHAYGAQFAEVGVDEDTGIVRLRRMLGVFAAGRILNPRTARSQLLGGMIMGVGMALMEQSWVDGRFGHFANHDLAEYHVPMGLDVANIEAITLHEEDHTVNPLGIKGVGEIGIVGAAAAIANAVHHATGVRVRSTPVTLDKVLGPSARAAR